MIVGSGIGGSGFDSCQNHWIFQYKGLCTFLYCIHLRPASVNSGPILLNMGTHTGFIVAILVENRHSVPMMMMSRLVKGRLMQNEGY